MPTPAVTAGSATSGRVQGSDLVSVEGSPTPATVFVTAGAVLCPTPVVISWAVSGGPPHAAPALTPPPDGSPHQPGPADPDPLADAHSCAVPTYREDVCRLDERIEPHIVVLPPPVGRSGQLIVDGE